MVGRWFFMIIGIVFSITPAFVYWLAGGARPERRPDGPDGRRHRRLHDPPEPALLPARLAAQRPGRDPGRARPVRPDLRVPRHRSGDRRRARGGRPRSRDRPGPGPLPRRVVPLPEPGRAGHGRAGRRATTTWPTWPPRWDPMPPSPLAGAEAVGAGPPLELPELPIVPGFGLEDVDFEAAPGRARGARRAVGGGQDDDHLPHPAAVRRRLRGGRDRRPRHPVGHASSRSAG